MARRICIADQKKRDAEVEIASPPKREGWHFVSPEGDDVSYDVFIKNTERHTYESLAAEIGEGNALSDALIESDPEFDSELVGRRVGEADRVYLKHDGTVLYSTRILKVVTDPEGEEVSRDDFTDVEATVDSESPLPWTGRLLPVEDVVRRFVVTRKMQLRHVNGLTFDFLFDIAKTLHESGKMLFVGAGSKGNKPLIFRANGSPYRGFLHGRVDGNAFSLELHLSNMELKRLSQ